MQSPFPTDNEWHIDLIESYQKGSSGQLGQWLELFDRLREASKLQKSRLNLRSLPQNLLKRTVISN